MKFIYPAIFRQTETGNYEGYFPDLEDCRAEGETLEDAVENANAAANDWITIELEEEHVQLPPVSDPADLKLREGEVVRNISVTLRLFDGWDE